jgi:hypothetical protein
MNEEVVITAFAFIDEIGFGASSKGVKKWDEVPGASRGIRWKMFSDEPFEHFGRMDAPSKYAVAAVELTGIRKSVLPENTAISFGTEYGCLGADIDFYSGVESSGAASPLVFSYTLPNMPVAEIAMRYKITGPNFCFTNGAESGLVALWEGVQLIEDGEAPACLCIWCDAFSYSSIKRAEKITSKSLTQLVCAFFLETDLLAKKNSRIALARVCVENLPRNKEKKIISPLRDLCEFLLQASRDTKDKYTLSAPYTGLHKTMVVDRCCTR